MTSGHVEKSEWDLCTKLAERLVKDEIAPVVEAAFANLLKLNDATGMRPLLGNMIAAQVAGHMMLDSLSFARAGCDAQVRAQFTNMVLEGIAAAAALVDHIYERELVH